MSNVNAYDLVLSKVLEALDKGCVPWRKSWTSIYPTNYYTKKEYHGINVFLLGMMPFKCPYWIGYVQAGYLGGVIKKGEKATKILKWNIFDMKKKLEEEADNGKDRKLKYMYPLVFNVFNLEQTEGIDWDMESVKRPEETIQEPENIIAKYHGCNPELKIEFGVNPLYRPSEDMIMMPPKVLFDEIESYYSTFFHDIAHSTGSKNRLCREGVVKDIMHGSNRYSQEELVAEMTAAFLLSDCNIEVKQDNSIAYIKGWSEFLKNKKRAIVSAAREAQQASNFIKHNTKSDIDYDFFSEHEHECNVA